MKITNVKVYDLEESVKELHSIIQASHNSSFRNIDFIKEIREDIKVFSEGE